MKNCLSVDWRKSYKFCHLEIFLRNYFWLTRRSQKKQDVWKLLQIYFLKMMEIVFTMIVAWWEEILLSVDFFWMDFISAGSNKSFWMEDFSKCQFEEFSKCRFEESSKCRFKEFSKSLDAKIVESSKVTCQMQNWSLEVFYKRWRKWWNFLSIETVVFFNVSSSRWK